MPVPIFYLSAPVCISSIAQIEDCGSWEFRRPLSVERVFCRLRVCLYSFLCWALLKAHLKSNQIAEVCANIVMQESWLFSMNWSQAG